MSRNWSHFAVEHYIHLIIERALNTKLISCSIKTQLKQNENYSLVWCITEPKFSSSVEIFFFPFFLALTSDFWYLEFYLW